MAKLAWNEIKQFLDGNGKPYAGAQLFTYEAGSSTKETTYQDSASSTPHANPIILDSDGKVPALVWLSEGQAYKFVLAPSDDTDPPASPIETWDNVTGINDTNTTLDQWTDPSLTATYVSGTSFTVPGDHTSTLHVGRRVKITHAGGTSYGYIATSAYTTLTTVTVTFDSGSMTSPISNIWISVQSADNHSDPLLIDTYPLRSDPSDKSKKVRVDAGRVSTSTTRALFVGDADQYFPDFSQMHGANIGEMNCRLTLTSGTPVTTSDVTDAETLYLTPYKGNRIWLYDTTLTLWVPYALAEISIDVPDATGMYDVFVYDNSGTVTLEVVAWANTTTRATALTTQDGVYVKTGELDKRYVGSFYSTTDGNGQIADSAAKRHLWNMYNRVVRTLERKESTASWNYTTASWRQAKASTDNQVSVARGLNEDAMYVDVMVSVTNSTATERGAFVGIGLDSTSTPTGRWSQASVAGAIRQAQAGYSGLPGIGFHYFAWLEMGTGSDTLTWYGVGGVKATQAGIGGWTLA